MRPGECFTLLLVSPRNCLSIIFMVYKPNQQDQPSILQVSSLGEEAHQAFPLAISLHSCTADYLRIFCYWWVDIFWLLGKDLYLQESQYIPSCGQTSSFLCVSQSQRLYRAYSYCTPKPKSKVEKQTNFKSPLVRNCEPKLNFGSCFPIILPCAPEKNNLHLRLILSRCVQIQATVKWAE